MSGMLMIPLKNRNRLSPQLATDRKVGIKKNTKPVVFFFVFFCHLKKKKNQSVVIERLRIVGNEIVDVK